MERRDSEKREGRSSSIRDWAKNPSLGGFVGCVKPPDGVDVYKLDKVGTFQLDFVDSVAGQFNRRADAGFAASEFEYECHRVKTPSGAAVYACRKVCFGQPCAVCDWLQKHGGTADPDMVKEMRSKQRHMWVVVDPNDKKHRPKVLDTGHNNRGMGFAELMADAVGVLREGAEPFALQGGYTATLVVKELPMNNGKTYKGVTRIDFQPRDYDYPTDLMDSFPCLDDCLTDPGYETVAKMLETGDVEDDDAVPPTRPERKASRNGDEDDAPPARRPVTRDEDDSPPPARRIVSRDTDEPPPAKKKAEDEPATTKAKTAEQLGFKRGDLVVYGDLKECEIMKVSKDGTQVELEGPDGDNLGWISPSELSKFKGREAAEAPKPAAPKAAAKDDDDEPPPPKKRAAVVDEDEPPAKKKAVAAEDEDEPPPARSRKPVVEDDDDDDPPPAKKKPSRPVEDEPLQEEDDPPPAKKKTVKK